MATGSELDFRDNTPAAGSGYQLGKFQKGPTSGTDPVYQLPIYPLSVEMPANGGVSKLTAGATAAIGDCGKLLSFTLSGAATYALPATPPSVPDGGGTNRWKVAAQNETGSTASLTLSATSPAKLDGTTAGTLALTPGSGVQIYTDGTDYFTERGVTSPVGLATQAGVQQQSYTYAADTGAANAYAVSLTPAPTIGAGSVVVFKAANANTGASTLAVNGGSATPIKKEGSVALIAGDIAAGQIVCVVNDGTNWQMFGVPALPVGSSTQQGILQVDGTSITASAGIASATGAPVVKGVYTGNTAFFSSGSTPSSPVTAAFGSNIAAGNAILLFVEWFGGSLAVTSITDTLGNSYSLVATDGTNQICYAALNSPGGANTITVNFTSTFPTLVVRAFEYQNIVAVSAVDGSNVTHTDTGGGVYVASITTTNPSDVLVGHGIMGGLHTGGTFATGYATEFTHQDSVTNSTEWLVDKNVTSAGAQTLTWTESTVTTHSLLLVGLKVATGVTDFNGATGHVELTVTTTGTSGAATISGTNLNIPNYGAAPAGGMVLISKQTLASAAASVTFSSIPNSYSALMLMISATSATAAVNDDLWMQLNGDTGSNYANSNGYTDNGGTHNFASTGTATPDIATISGATSSVKFGSVRLEIPNYAGSIAKSWTTQSAAAASASTKELQNHYASGMWNSTAAITAIKLAMFSGANFTAGSVFALYGLP